MKHLLLTAALLLPFAAHAQTTPTHCFNTVIQDVDAGGTQLTIDAGWILDVYPGQDPAVKFWDPLDKLQVCALGGAAYLTPTCSATTTWTRSGGFPAKVSPSARTRSDTPAAGWAAAG